MSLRCRNLVWASVLVLSAFLLRAPAATNPVAPSRSNAAPRMPLSLLLLPTQGKSPVALFRELLAMTPPERNRFLANRSPEARRQILSKVWEYELSKPNERELRLKVTELRWYMWPLMNLRDANRASLLARIPEDDRALVEARLREWDKLSPAVQKELLDNEAMLRYFYELATSTPSVRSNIVSSLTPRRRAMLEKGIAGWNTLSQEQQQKMLGRFNQFFELTPGEKQKVLNTVSDAERKQIEKTLFKFEQLPPAKREQCINNFERFASLSLDERQQFLKNAERWKLMSPDERQAWRDLVRKLAPNRPPLPPGLEQRVRSRQPPVTPPVATNGP
jgi:hypothetical protein